MKKIIFALVTLVFISCQNKEVLLPELDKTIVQDVDNHSLIYFFFKTEKNDTVIDVNRNNTISSTNWIFNIDKRLPLKLVIPEVIKLQDKKESSLHKDTTSQNYFSYSNKVKRQLAFLPFNKVFYKMENPKNGIIVYFNKNNTLFLNEKKISKPQLEEYLETTSIENLYKIQFCFNKEASYELFIQNCVFLNQLEIKRSIDKFYFY